MATNTSNYNLIKPSQEDFYNIEDQNTNMDIIDAQLKSEEEVLANHNHDGRYETPEVVQTEVAAAEAAAKAYTDQKVAGVGGELSSHLSETASETAKGHVELATAAETTAGTDETKAVSPKNLKIASEINVINGVTTADANTLIKSGVYRIGPSNLNIPAECASGQLLVMHGASDTIAQIVTDYSSTAIYWRSGWPAVVGGGGTWGAWRQIWHSGKMGPGSGLDADLLDGKHASNLAVYSPNVLASVLQDTTNLASGFYTVSDGLLQPNGSLFASGWWHVIHMKHANNNGYAHQVAYTLDTTNTNIYERSTINTGTIWSNWRKMLTQTDYDVLNARMDNYGSINSVATSYTIQLAVANQVVYTANASAITISIPTNAVAAFPLGTQITFVQENVGTVTFLPLSGVVLNSKDTKRIIDGRYASATLIKASMDGWYLIGALA